jgi:hypothetical protein
MPTSKLNWLGDSLPWGFDHVEVDGVVECSW